MIKKLLFLFLSCFSLLTGSSVQAQAVASDLVVAQDGSSSYKTIQEALAAVPAGKAKRTIIFIKPGTYKEKLVVPADKMNISFIGENKDNTRITFDDHSGKGNINTATSYTVLVKGDGFRAENITFENTAGRDAGQAVALHVAADKCVFQNCNIIANQDTYFASADKSRQYFKNCYIEGTTDFIFGSATVVFEDCTIDSKKNSYITAASTPQEKPFGFVFINCKLTASPEATQVYLGRPWRNYARTVFIRCELGSHILPAGWHNWKKPEAEATAFYAEYKSQGSGANNNGRVPWSKQLTRKEVRQYTVKNILSGTDAWNPLTSDHP